MPIRKASNRLLAMAAAMLFSSSPALAEDALTHRSYVRLHGGADTFMSGGEDSGTFVAGAGIGHDLQFGDLVLGIYAGVDFPRSGIVSVRDLRGPRTIEFEARPGRDIELSARAGVWMKDVLVYARAGYSNARFTLAHAEYTAPFQGARIMGGLRLASGAEIPVTPSLSGVAELRYSAYDYNIRRAQMVAGLMLRF